MAIKMPASVRCQQFQYYFIIFSFVWKSTVGTVFYNSTIYFNVLGCTGTAFLGIQWTETEQTVQREICFVTGVIFTPTVVEKFIVVTHIFHLA